CHTFFEFLLKCSLEIIQFEVI
ncbi:hypothetical protein CEXT_492561, partial [Caerostris extrusa]